MLKNFGFEMNCEGTNDLHLLIEHRQNVPEKCKNLRVNKYLCVKTSEVVSKSLNAVGLCSPINSSLMESSVGLSHTSCPAAAIPKFLPSHLDFQASGA